MKKLLSFILAIVTVFTCFSFAACGGGGDVVGENDLLIWSPAIMVKDHESVLKKDPTSISGHYTKAVMDEFKKVHPESKVVIVDQGWAETLNEKIIQQYNVSQPDLVGSETYAQTLITEDYLSPLPSELLQDIIPATTEIFNRDGNTYVMPVCTNSFVFIYNEKLMLQAGCPSYVDEEGEDRLLVPQTWAEVLYCCEKVDGYFNSHYDMSSQINQAKYGACILNNVTGIAQSFRVDMFTQLAGGSMYKEGALSKSTTVSDLDYENPKNVEGLEMMRALYKYAPYGSYTLENEQSTRDFLLRGEIAMMFCHPDPLSSTTAANGVELKGAALPLFVDGDSNLEPYAYSENNRQLNKSGVTARQRRNVLVGNIGWGIVKSSTKKELATDFLKVATSAVVQEKLFEHMGRLPTTKAGLQAVINSENATVIKKAKNMQSSIDELKASYENPESVHLVGGTICFSKNVMSAWGSYDDIISKVYSTDTDISTLLSQMTTNVSKWLA